MDLHPDTITLLDACAGFGMLGESIHLALESLGIPAERIRTLVVVERDAAAAAAFVARMEKTALGAPLVADCLESFDGRPWRGCFDIACAGLPCQPYSLAGKRAGNSDARSHGEDGEGPIPHFLRIIGESLPTLVFLENVPAWVVGGHFRSVGEELCRLGFTIEDPIFLAAADVGAPHERERVFILAHRLANPAIRRGWIDLAERGADRRGIAGGTSEELAHRAGAGRNGSPQRDDRNASSEPESGRDNEPRDPELADGNVVRRRSQGHDQSGVGTGQPSEIGEQLGDAECLERELSGITGIIRGAKNTQSGKASERQWNGDAAGDPCSAIPLFPPGRGAEDAGLAKVVARAQKKEHVSAIIRGVASDFNEWGELLARGLDPSLMPRVEPELSMVADGLAFSRSDLLRIGGNGVVPLAAAVAFRTLLADAIGRIKI